MKRREIAARFDDIVEFSGVEKFIDTPVKRYSSGMYVRLAFAVAAHLEPEILFVDEVLAVGDAEFQTRCLGRMEDFGNSGARSLFVSHNMQAVAQLCDRAILLDEGRPRSTKGRARRSSRTTSRPRQAPAPAGRGRTDDAPGTSSSGFARCVSSTTDGTTVDYVDVRRPVGIELAFTVLGEAARPSCRSSR